MTSSPPAVTDAAPVNEPTVSRSSDATRSALLDAATTVFAEHGYRDGSVRVITRAAGANQAAITYHFGGKEELYRAVLRAAVNAFEDQSFLTSDDVLQLDRAEALRRTMRQFLMPLTQPGRLGRYVRILGWEGVHPTPVYLAFFSEETPRLFTAVELLVRRFLPPQAGREEVALVAHWLVQQPIAFRSQRRTAQAPALRVVVRRGRHRQAGHTPDVAQSSRPRQRT